MSLVLRSSLGYSGGPLHFCSADEVVWVSGNVLTIYKLGATTRLLRGSAFGISCFTTSRHHGLIAFAEKGPIPSVRIHRLSDLDFVGSISPDAELDITALSFSSDGTRLSICSSEPELTLGIYEWKQGELVVSATLPLGSTANEVSFHPHNANLLCTTGNGPPLEWRLEKLWGKYEVSHSKIEVPEGLGATTCHAWFPGGLYLGFSTGQILAVDIQASAPPQPQINSFSPPGSALSGALRPSTKKEVAALGLAAAYDSPRSGPRRNPTFISATGSSDSPVTAISVSRDHVAVAAGSEPIVRWFNHAFPPSHLSHDDIYPNSFKPHATQAFGSSEYISVIGLDLGGDEFDVAAVGLSDGSVRLFGASNEGGTDASASVEEIAVEAHAGAITGLATHPDHPGRFLSSGEDGVLRVWEVVGAQYEQQKVGSNVSHKQASQHHAPTIAPRCIDRRTFSSAQTALASSSSHLLAALGSEGGVVRIVSLAEGGPRPLSVVFRRRLHPSAVVSLAFSPNGNWLASAGRDGTISFICLSNGATSALVVGYVTCPDPIIGLVWPVVTDADDCVLVTLASGAVLSATVPEELSKARRPSHHPGLQLGKEVTVRVVKVETALVCAAGLAGPKYGELVGLGSDKMLHRIPLPMEGQAWGGLKGRVSKSSIKTAAHEGALGDVAVSGPNALVVATASADGHVACHVASSLDPIGSTKSTGLGSVHDATRGGASYVAMDLSGRWIISAGQDGSMFAHEALLPPALYPPPPPAAPAVVVPKMDFDAFDDPTEPTEADLHRHQAPTSVHHNSSSSSSSAHQGLSAGAAAKLEALREKLRGCIAKNDAADELEKLSKTDMIVDKALAAELGSLADARVASVREELKKEHLKLELVAHRVKKGCYEEMSGQKGAAVTAMKCGLEIHNFPLVAPDTKLLQKVAMLRQVELIEVAEEKKAMALASKEAFDPSSATGLHSEPSMSVLNASMMVTQELPPLDEGEDYLSYNDLELHGQLRKAAQIVFFRQRLYDIQASFNADFEAVSKLKRSEADRILDLNVRIDETLRDLVKIGGSTSEVEKFVAPFPEDMKRVLEVKDSEVSVEKVASSAEGKAGEEGVGRGQVGGGRDAATLTDRALKQMMGGTLASKVEEADPFALERPSWMDGNPKLFGEDQLRALREFQAKERAMNEERAKKISSLESELRSLKASVEEAASKFDESVQGLLAKKIKAMSEVEALELRIVALSGSIDQCQRTGDSAERDEFISMSTHNDAKARIISELNERRSQLNDAEVKATEISGEERLLDKNFKREFGDTEDFYPKLLQIYRYREGDALPTPKHREGHDHHSHEASKGTPSMSLNMPRVPSIPRAPSMSRATPPGKSQMSANLGPSAAKLGANSMIGIRSFMASTNIAADATLAREASLRALSSKTMDPFPPLPLSCLDHHDPYAADDAILSSAMASGSHKPIKSFHLPDSMCPEGLDQEWWSKLVVYRARKVQCEAELGLLTRRMNLLFKDVTKLEAEEKRLASLSEERLAAVQAIRRERHLAVYDTALQLKMKAGQVEATPPALVSSDLSAARLLHREVVEEINEAVRQRGDKKVEIMTAIKDFKKGIYQLEWEHQKCDLLVEVLREKTKELQMLHVTRELQSVFRSNGAPVPSTSTTPARGGEGGPPSDHANLEALAKQREVNQKKLLQERQRKLQKVNKLIEEKRQQNEEVSRHLITLEKVLQEQERLRMSMQTMEDQNSRRMRSMVTLKKLKDISAAQKTEIMSLTSELDRLRCRTFPTFMDPSATANSLPPDTKNTLWQ